MKKTIVVLATLFAATALASAIKVWAPGDTLSSTDLNSNFSHIHGLMVGGHGARLVNADVNASAAIEHSKLATPGVLPKSVFTIGSDVSPCTAGTCTLSGYAGSVTSATWSATGTYEVTIPARSNSLYGVLVTPQFCTGSANCMCFLPDGKTTTSFNVKCIVPNTAATINAVVSVLIFDDNN